MGSGGVFSNFHLPPTLFERSGDAAESGSGGALSDLEQHQSTQQVSSFYLSICLFRCCSFLLTFFVLLRIQYTVLDCTSPKIRYMYLLYMAYLIV